MSIWDDTLTTGVDLPPPSPLRITRWAPIAAVHGPGTLLLGPHADGAQAIVPPAVLARTPASSDAEYSEAGWRLAVWRFAPEGDALVEAHRPQRLEAIDLNAAITLVRREAPAHEQWLRGQIELRAQCLGVLIRQASVDGWRLRELRTELDDLLLDATCRIGAAWVRERIGALAL